MAHRATAASRKTKPLYFCRPEPLRTVSFEELSFEELSFDELSLDEPALDELSLPEASLDELSDFGLSSVLSLDPESPEDPGEEDFLA